MLTLVSGAYHPSLESALIKHVAACQSDPFTPIAIVTPSARLSEQLQLRLGQAFPGLLQVHFHTFSSLAQEVVDNAGGLPKPVLSDPLFFDALVKMIVKNDRPFPGLEDLAVPQGFPPQVRGTIRDLIDAGVPATGPLLLDAVKEDFLGRNVDLGWLLQLLRFYQIYAEKINSLPVLPRTSVLKAAIEFSPKSSFLKQFREILYYGFYDLTGLQVEFFQRVVKNHPARLYFPFIKNHPSYVFSSRFRDTYLQPVISEEIQLDQVEKETLPEFQVSEGVKTKIINVSGTQDQAWAVATEILKLHHEKGISFRDIAVVARTQEQLRTDFQKIFREHDIPIQTNLAEPLLRSPQVQDGLRLLDSLKAPEWPKKKSWSKFSEKLIGHIQKSILFGSEKSQQVWHQLIDGIEKMSVFDALSSTVTWEEYKDNLRDRWLKTEWRPGHSEGEGVSLLHAEASRGLSFDVIFAIGLEERVFPRILREDPFLRDDARLAITNTLGFKVNAKMVALEEERLLFQLIVSSAQTHLYLLYQRSNDEGGVVGPSPFLRSLAAGQKIDMETDVVSVPRLYSEKLKNRNPVTLSKRDVIMRYLWTFNSDKAVEFVKASDQDGASLERGLKVQHILHQFENPSIHDGNIGEVNLRDLFNKGQLSPTALEIYGRCPWQFFVTKILDLEPLEEEPATESMEPDIKGSLIHEFLERFFKEITKEGTKPLPRELPISIFNKLFKTVFPEKMPSDIRLHPVLWETARTKVKADLFNYCQRTWPEKAGDSLQPAYFEQRIVAQLNPPLDRMTWIGSIDRMDVSNGTVRIIDYKSGRLVKDKVATAATKGRALQPPLYLLMAEKFFETHKKKYKTISFVYHPIHDREKEKELTHQDWSLNRDRIIDTLKEQLHQMERGNFLMLPDSSYCGYCEIKNTCRINHSLSAYRAAQGPGEKLRTLRQKRALTTK